MSGLSVRVYCRQFVSMILYCYIFFVQIESQVRDISLTSGLGLVVESCTRQDRVEEIWNNSLTAISNCPQSRFLSKHVTLKLKQWAALSEDMNVCFMKASHVLLPNKVEFTFREVQSKEVNSCFGSMLLQDDFCLICEALQAKHPDEVDIRCYGQLIEAHPFDQGVQEIFLCCMYAMPSWITVSVQML